MHFLPYPAGDKRLTQELIREEGGSLYGLIELPRQ